MNGDWLDREALITVKAYPNPSAKHSETVFNRLSYVVYGLLERASSIRRERV